eukprot:12211630-Alexandrium_andersonii.AAC.1
MPEHQNPKGVWRFSKATIYTQFQTSAKRPTVASTCVRSAIPDFCLRSGLFWVLTDLRCLHNAKT